MPVVKLPLPPSTNNSYGLRGKTRYMYSEARLWKTASMWTFKKFRGSEPTTLTIRYYLKFNRDVDGSHKLILDAMQERGEGAGVMKDDKTITELHLFKYKDKENPRVEVEW